MYIQWRIQGEGGGQPAPPPELSPPPEYILHPPEHLSLLPFIKSNSLTKSKYSSFRLVDSVTVYTFVINKKRDFFHFFEI